MASVFDYTVHTYRLSIERGREIERSSIIVILRREKVLRSIHFKSQNICHVYAAIYGQIVGIMEYYSKIREFSLESPKKCVKIAILSSEPNIVCIQSL